MAQDVKIAGVNYSAVPSIIVPKQNSGNASFFDVSDTTAVASDVASGKYFYTANGTKTIGTAKSVYLSSFSTGSTVQTTHEINTGYNGSGYPIFFQCWIDGGISNSNYSWSSRDIGEYTFVKSDTSLTPDYTVSETKNYMAGTVYYRSSNGWSTSGSATTRVLYNTTPNNSATSNVIRIKNKNTIGYYVRSTSNTEYGLKPNCTYWYLIGYSS